MRTATVASVIAACAGDKSEDLITSLPGFPTSTWGFKAYSGLLKVPGPVAGYDSLNIHYQFHTAQKNPESAPVATWHQGGPGGSSITVGLYGEMGVFQVGDESHGNYLNPWAWNKVANMLYLESPAGSGDDSGYSQCLKNGVVVGCQWDDQSQAEAYAHTLQAFFKAYPEYAKNDFYLTGESYFGQYGPNIAHFILNDSHFSKVINLRGIAAGNACWGGTETCVACNGPNQDKIDVELFFGKGLFSPSLKKKIDGACEFPTQYGPSQGSGPFRCENDDVSSECTQLLKEMRREVGPHNVYDIYDNCEHTHAFLERTGKDMGWLTSVLRDNLHNTSATHKVLVEMNGGYPWDCNGDVDSWITSTEVRKSLHLDAVEAGQSSFDYSCSGPASITLWPELAKKIRVLIYNGDADACVPYNGNEQWIKILEDNGDLKEVEPWSPWFTHTTATPAGYITQYQAPGATVDFAFATIRLAGHMAPTFQPEASFVMISNFFKKGSEQSVV